MSSDDVRNRFRGSGRRDYVGPMPARQPAPQAPPRPQPPMEQRRPDPEPYYERAEPPKAKKPKKSRKKLWITLLILLILLGAGAGAYWKFFKKDKSVVEAPTANNLQQTEQTQQQPVETKKTLRFVATGDMIAHGAILEQGKTASGYDFSPMLTNMTTFFVKSDVSFCNQATPAGGSTLGLSGYPVFNAPLEWPKAIEGVGCNVINLGSNHTNDKGQALIDATVAAWDKRPVLAVVGANRNAEEQAKVRYFDKDGVKFAIFSYSTYTNSPLTTAYGINMYDTATAQKQIAEAQKKADIIIVSMRWGTEYSPGVDANQDRIAQELASAGADVVLGHGPHFLEPVKKLKGKNGKVTWVWFSLGNFLNAQIETEALIGGFAVIDIDISSKKIAEPKFMPVYMHYEWTAAQKAANDLLSRKNFQMYPLDQAAVPMGKSQIGTTVDAQTKRVTDLLNTFTPVTIIKSDQF